MVVLLGNTLGCSGIGYVVLPGLTDLFVGAVVTLEQSAHSTDR